MQRLQVFLHFSLPSALPHQVADFAFVGHHVAVKPGGTLSSHVGGGAHGVAAPHFFLTHSLPVCLARPIRCSSARVSHPEHFHSTTHTRSSTT